MRNIRLIIEYEGLGFNGWQSQGSAGKKLKTVQEEIEKAAKKLLGKKISLTGASRTDSGVHARAQAANFRTNSKLNPENIKNGLNRFLPRRISIISAEYVPLKFHSRFDSKGKLYKYTIVNRKSRSPLLERHAAYYSYYLDIPAMRKAAKCLIGRKDFKSFQTAGKKEKNSVRTVKKIEIISNPPVVEIYVQADGFLYNMVRNIAGTLMEVGRGRFKPGTVKEILDKKHRSSAGQTAPAKGLCLEKVFYGI
ncbi:MAG: tRNA pseudouridine(38-40) synthase TruA [Candidatus Omnitrophota bacterium]|jgi:tRNA pseudouridine38-40 synthase